MSSPPNREGSLRDERKRWLSYHLGGAHTLGHHGSKQEGTNSSGPKFPVLGHSSFLFSSDRKGRFSDCNGAGVWVVSGNVCGVHKHHQTCHLHVTNGHHRGSDWGTHAAIPRPLVKKPMEVTVQAVTGVRVAQSRQERQ